MGGLLQLPPTARSSRRADPLRTAPCEDRQAVTCVLRPYKAWMARPERFELPTSWFVVGALNLWPLILLTNSAWRPLHLAPPGTVEHDEPRKSPATTWRQTLR